MGAQALLARDSELLLQGESAMLELSCVPYTALQVLYYAYGSTKLLQLTLGSAGNALEDDSDVEVVAPEKKSIFSALPLELLGEIVLLLPCSLYKSARTVSRMWLETLNPECQWERVCRMQWPGVTQIMSHSWRKFALQGGGDLLGACLLHHLQKKFLACSATAVAQCC